MATIAFGTSHAFAVALVAHINAVTAAFEDVSPSAPLQKRTLPARSTTALQAVALWLLALCIAMAAAAFRRQRRCLVSRRKACTIVPVGSSQRRASSQSRSPRSPRSPRPPRRLKCSSRRPGSSSHSEGAESEGLLADTEAPIPADPTGCGWQDAAICGQLADDTPDEPVVNWSPGAASCRRRKVRRSRGSASTPGHQPHQRPRHAPPLLCVSSTAKGQQNTQVEDVSSMFERQTSWPSKIPRFPATMKRAKSWHSAPSSGSVAAEQARLSTKGTAASITDEHPSATKLGQLEELRHSVLTKKTLTLRPFEMQFFT
mmetsp:Transcript_26135/g.48180  ORF Transcript_26135/g.48180 Transcript_26135/m.48180 type:complete len:316 (+) Transcript_26135:114-1061(+)